MPFRPKTHGQSLKRGKFHSTKPNTAQEGYGGLWRKLRLRYLSEHPLCVKCQQNGLTEPAKDVDHITPRRAGGSDLDTNLQALCHSCHSKKTQIDRRQYDLDR